MNRFAAYRHLRVERMAFAAVLVLAAGTSNLRSLVSWGLHPVGQQFSDHAWLELGGWLVTVLLVLWLLVREDRLAEYGNNWRRQPGLVLFLAICTASLLWSVNPLVTAFRITVLLSATSIAAYIGMRCKPAELLRYLAWFCAIVIVASAWMALTDPLLGKQRIYGPDVWRGIFWNKNHLGSVSALCSAVLLLRILDVRSPPGWFSRLLFVPFYLLALVAIYKSRSGTGGLVALILHLLVLLSTLWACFESRLRRAHYVWLAACGLILAAAVLANVETIFGAFNKDLKLSGRWDLWNYLLWDVIPRHLLLGHGFGALWGDTDFRALAAVPLGMVPVIGDNGFIDIALGVGVVGLISFLLVYYAAWKGAVSYLRREKGAAGNLPLIVMCASLFSNLGFSLLMEIEVFFWGLIVAVLFSTATRGAEVR
jgi:exopolysaccharide production protein ExoQ